MEEYEEIDKNKLEKEDIELIEENKLENFKRIKRHRDEDELEYLFEEKSEDEKNDFIVEKLKEDQKTLIDELFGDGSEYQEMFIDENKESLEKEIQTEDIPERLKNFPKAEEATNWCYKQILISNTNIRKEDVRNVLLMFEKDLFEVPFIAVNRKELIGQMGLKDLWLLYDLVFEWKRLRNRQKAIFGEKITYDVLSNIEMNDLLLQTSKDDVAHYGGFIDCDLFIENIKEKKQLNVPDDNLMVEKALTQRNLFLLEDEIVKRPEIRKNVREYLLNGIKIEFFDFKTKKKEEKELEALKESEYLFLLSEEEKGNIQMSFILNEDFCFSMIKDFYLTENKQNNFFREKILRNAIKRISETVKKEQKEKIHRNSIQTVCSRISVEFNKRLCQKNFDFKRKEKRLCVMTTDNENIICTVIGQTGSLIKKIITKDFTLSHLREELLFYRPEFIGVSGIYPQVRFLFKTTKKVFEEDENCSIKVEYVDDEFARIKTLKKNKKKDFVEYCLSLCRQVLCPLHEIASCNYISDVILDPEQIMIPIDSFNRTIERCFINIVNTLGLDLNLLITSKGASCCLKYICGFSDSIAQSLIENIKKENFLFLSRKDLLSFVSEKIYVNSSRFLFISNETVGNGYQPYILDTLHIHPENYLFIEEIAKKQIQSNNKDLCCVSELINRIDLLSNLKIEEYSNELEEETGIKRNITFEEIKTVLLEKRGVNYNPFGFVQSSLSKKRIFEMLCSYKEKAPSIGQLIEVKIQTITQNNIKCYTKGDVSGNIPFHYIDQSNEDIQIRFSLGNEITCCIMDIDYVTFSIVLSCREKDTGVRSTEKCSYVSRICHHPLFVNRSRQKTLEFLKDKPVGEFLIRPGSRGANHLVITLKIEENLFYHINVREERKTTDFSIGQFLFIENIKFNSIEGLVLYSKRIQNCFSEIRSFKKYVKQDLDSPEKIFCENLLREQKEGNTIPYLLTFSYSYPGKVLLVTLFKECVFEYIEVHPEWYLFRKNKFKTLSELINFFKKQSTKK